MVPRLIDPIRDHRVDVVCLQPVPERTGAVPLVPSHRVRPQAIGCLPQQRNGFGALMALASGERYHHRFAAALGDEMEFAAPAAATPA